MLACVLANVRVRMWEFVCLRNGVLAYVRVCMCVVVSSSAAFLRDWLSRCMVSIVVLS